MDLHFHGAFGIDLMRAEAAELDELSRKLWEQGIGAFVATTLSVPQPELRAACARLGAWIRSGTAPGAIPLGLHLEGPFISPEAAGAHPPGSIRPLTLQEVQDLWELSQGTLKILTVAPETLDPGTLRGLTRWCRAKKVVLSAGHSRATQEQAEKAFDSGFTGVTHAWNAMNFHQRAPGLLGGALGRKDVYLELIIDQAHVHRTVLRWTRSLHSRCCFVSDCVPAAQTREGTWHSFGENLQIRFDGQVCRLSEGALAGGGRLLGQSYGQWLQDEARDLQVPLERLLRQTVSALTREPLRALGLSPAVLRKRRVFWEISRSAGAVPRPIPELTRSVHAR